MPGEASQSGQEGGAQDPEAQAKRRALARVGDAARGGMCGCVRKPAPGLERRALMSKLS